jgi:hypothetical protein
LVPGKKSQWNNAYGATLGSRKKIYLFSSLDPAIQLASRMEWGIKKPVDILVIEFTPPDLEPDPSLEANMEHPGTWWMTSTVVPPTAIKQVLPLTMEMKRDYIKRRDARFAQS